MAEHPTRLPSDGPGSAGWWSEQLSQAKKARDKLKLRRRDLVKRYRAEVRSASPDAVRVNIEFEKTEQKRHQLFYQVPTLRLTAHPRTSREAREAVAQFEQAQGAGQSPRDIARAVKIFQEVLQRYAGSRGLNTKKLIDTALFDVLCPAGIAACIVGFERFTQGTVEIEDGMRDPTPEEIQQQNPGSVLGLQAQSEVPNMVQVPNVLFWRIFASRISPGHLYVPVDFTGNAYSTDADWLAFDFRIPVHVARQKKWRIPKDVATASMQDDDLLVEPSSRHEAQHEQLACREVWCYPQRIYSDVPHPLRLRRLIFVEGVEQPVVVEDGRHQEFDERGRFLRGLTSNPIKVLTLRYASDTWVPPSDCWVSQGQAEELSNARTQMIVHRKRSGAMRWVDINRIPDARVRELINKGEYYALIPTDGPGDQIVGELSQAQYPRENFTFQEVAMGDIDRLWALGANQQGVRESTTRTATELSLIQQATENRLTGEKGAVTDYWISIMETTSKLLQLYAENEDYVEIVGETGAKEIAAWNRDEIQGEFLFAIIPDSSDRPDQAHIRDLALNEYNLFSNSPVVNTKQLVRKTLEALGELDVDSLLQDPPQQEPEGPRVSLSMKSESLAPGAPELENVERVLRAKGLEIDLETTRVDETGTAPPGGAEQLALPLPGGVDDGEPVGTADAVDPHSLQLDEAGSVDNRGGGLTDAG